MSAEDDKKPVADAAAKKEEDMSPEEILRREAKKKAKEEEKAAKAAKIAEKAAKVEAAAAAKAVAAAAPAAAASADGDAKKKKKGGAADGGDDAKEEVHIDATPKGEKKDMSRPMNEAYHPQSVEAAWGAWWEASGINSANAATANPKRFVMVIPPPNVTGTLHLGHALTCAVEDCIARWHRMSGYETLWVPGTDHAGIATQVIVEKKLQREKGQSRHDLGRENFLAEVWKWKEEHGSSICQQLRRLGASVDWSREAFTMDAKLSVAVTEAFCRLFDDGLMYRANRLVNWSCALRTAISDIEVEYLDLAGPKKLKVPGHDKMVEFGVLHSFAYKVIKQSADEADEEIVVSTTRLETMLGDVAVAVHPADPRYTKFHSRKLAHPFIAGRELKIVCDAELVDMAFGTGAVKITPAHDPNDFKCGQRHGLQFINIFDDEGKINANGGRFAGMMRYDVRYMLVQELTALGAFRGTTPNPMRLGLDSRSKDVVEPIIRPQWFCRCKGMADKAVDAVRTGALQLLPAGMHESTWNYWMENIQDWCVSRQLWWGHQIPAYLVTVDGESTPDGYSTEQWVVGRSQEEALTSAQKKYPGRAVSVVRDPDVLDTWFSSGLFPFSVFGWPNNTADMAAFYPTSLLETGHDIMFFWVARMVMMGQQLTGQLPFHKVYLHAMVRDKYGRKMSKSLGNVLDPIHVMEGITLQQLNATLRSGNLDPAEVEKAVKGQELDFPKGIPECGADALRFGLLAYTTQGRDINLDINRVVAYRQFCNKIWNATRFALQNFSTVDAAEASALAAMSPASLPGVAADAGTASFADRWILHQLHHTLAALDAAFLAYDFSAGTTLAYEFWWDVCDYYLELIKPVTRGDDAAAKRSATRVLYTCLDHGLRLMHPFMPFVTEELYQRLPGRRVADSIAVAAYPTVAAVPHWKDDVIAAQFSLFRDIVHAIRSAKASLGLEPSARPEITVTIASETDRAAAAALTSDAATLSKSASVRICAPSPSNEFAEGAAMSPVVGRPGVTLFVKLSGLVDFAAEIAKLRKTQTKLEENVAATRKKMAIPGWEDKTPEDIKIGTREKIAENEAQIAKLKESIVTFTALAAAAPPKQ